MIGAAVYNFSTIFGRKLSWEVMLMRKLAKRLWKKAAALLTVGTVGLTLSAPPSMVPTAHAGVGDVIGIAVAVGQVAKQRKEIKQGLEEINNTEEGRQQLFTDYKEKYKVNTDYTLNQEVQTVMTNMTKAVGSVDSTIYDKPYLWFINTSVDINAFCTLGHVMSINTGLLTKITNEDEIAAVIGHEMGHGQKDHAVKGYMKYIDRLIALNVGTAAVGGSFLSNLAASIADLHIGAHSTEKLEWEADNLAFEYMTHTNYNLGACAAVQQKFYEMFEEHKKGNGLFAKIFNPSDHPKSAKRRDNYIKKLSTYSGGHVNMKEGTITINKKLFVTPAETASMSSVERACFVMGNLAAAYHNGHNKSDAYVSGNTVYLGAQPIMTIEEGDEAAQVLVDRLNKNK